jgi:hypothetical protein
VNSEELLHCSLPSPAQNGFPVYFSTEFCLILVCIFISKCTNPVLKYPAFSEMLQKENYIKKISCFIAYGQVSKKNYIVFSYNKKSKYVLACILALITSLLKP